VNEVGQGEGLCPNHYNILMCMVHINKHVSAEHDGEAEPFHDSDSG